MDEATAWKELGQQLGEARERLRLSKRAAARKAGFSEITWRQLEAGERQIKKGLALPPSPSDALLESAALAVELEPGPLFEIVDRDYEPSTPARVRLDLEARVNDLERELMDVQFQLQEILDRLDGAG